MTRTTAPEAVELTAGKAYAIHVNEVLDQRGAEKLYSILAKEADLIGCHFMILPAGVRVVGVEDIEDA